MRKIKKYTGDKTYMFCNGSLATTEAVLAQFPAALTFSHIIETDEAEEVIFAVQNLSAMRHFYNIDAMLSENDAVAAIQEAVNAPPPIPEPTAEERIAAQMEYQTLMNL